MELEDTCGCLSSGSDPAVGLTPSGELPLRLKRPFLEVSFRLQA